MHWALNLKKFQRGYIYGIIVIMGLVLLIQTGAMAVPMQNFSHGNYFDLVRQTVVWGDKDVSSKNSSYHGWTGHSASATWQNGSQWELKNGGKSNGFVLLGGNPGDKGKPFGGWEPLPGGTSGHSHSGLGSPSKTGDDGSSDGDGKKDGFAPKTTDDDIIHVTQGPCPGPNTVPEPMTVILFGSGLVGLAVAKQKRYRLKI